MSLAKQMPNRTANHPARRRGSEVRRYTGVLYIGLGDQFDDDRRFVRVEALEFRPATRRTSSMAPTLATKPSPTRWIERGTAATVRATSFRRFWLPRLGDKPPA